MKSMGVISTTLATDINRNLARKVELCEPGANNVSPVGAINSLLFTGH
jgi:hypothetical protein